MSVTIRQVTTNNPGAQFSLPDEVRHILEKQAKEQKSGEGASKRAFQLLGNSCKQHMHTFFDGIAKGNGRATDEDFLFLLQDYVSKNIQNVTSTAPAHRKMATVDFVWPALYSDPKTDKFGSAIANACRNAARTVSHSKTDRGSIARCAGRIAETIFKEADDYFIYSGYLSTRMRVEVPGSMGQEKLKAWVVKAISYAAIEVMGSDIEPQLAKALNNMRMSVVS